MAGEEKFGYLNSLQIQIITFLLCHNDMNMGEFESILLYFKGMLNLCT